MLVVCHPLQHHAAQWIGAAWCCMDWCLCATVHACVYAFVCMCGMCGITHHPHARLPAAAAAAAGLPPPWLLLLPGCCCCLAAAAAAAAWLQAYYELTAAVAFPALALFNLLRFPIVMLPSQVCVWGPLGGGHRHAAQPARWGEAASSCCQARCVSGEGGHRWVTLVPTPLPRFPRHAWLSE